MFPKTFYTQSNLIEKFLINSRNKNREELQYNQKLNKLRKLPIPAGEGMINEQFRFSTYVEGAYILVCKNIAYIKKKPDE